MTIPTLINCPHTGEGWCLKCVYALNIELEKYQDFISNELYYSLLEDVDDKDCKTASDIIKENLLDKYIEEQEKDRQYHEEIGFNNAKRIIVQNLISKATDLFLNKEDVEAKKLRQLVDELKNIKKD